MALVYVFRMPYDLIMLVRWDPENNLFHKAQKVLSVQKVAWFRFFYSKFEFLGYILQQQSQLQRNLFKFFQYPKK